jgi:uncharacterized protein (TIGR02145 family)
MKPLATIFIFASLMACKKDDSGGNTSSFTDPRDGQVYTTRKIGTQVWMTRNLNYAAAGSSCYDSSESNCATYGRLYDWNTALTVAPSGWHLPSDAEWTTLITYLGGDSIAGGSMKATTLWLSPNTGATNSSGFAGLPGGGRDNIGGFIHVGEFGSWWSSTANQSWPNLSRGVNLAYNFTYIERIDADMTLGFSVRCVKD